MYKNNKKRCAKNCNCCKEPRTIPCIKTNTDCIFVTEDVECIEVNKGQTLTGAVKSIGDKICEIRDDISTTLRNLFYNVGTGAEIMKEPTPGTVQFKTLTSPEKTVEITSQEDEIELDTRILQTDSTYIEVNRNDGQDTISFKEIKSPQNSINVFEDSSNINLDTKPIQSDSPYIHVERIAGVDRVKFSGVGEVKSTDGTVTVNSQNEGSIVDLSIDIPEGHTIKEGQCLNGVSTIDVDGLNVTGMCLTSDTIEIVKIGDTIALNTAEQDIGGVPAIVVNNMYTGSEEEGTLIRPFKNLDSAIQEYVGNGTRSNPAKIGSVILVQSSPNPYNTTSDISYRDMSLYISDSATVRYTGSSEFLNTELIVNASGNHVRSTVNIIMESDQSRLEIISGSGIKTSGSNLGTSSTAQVVNITGGRLNIIGGYNPNRVLIDANSSNLPGRDQGSSTNLNLSNTRILSDENTIIISGLRMSIRIDNCQISSGSKANQLQNTELEAIISVGGSINFTYCGLQPLGARSSSTPRKYFIVLNDTNNGRVRLENCSILYPDPTEYYIYNKGGNTNTAEIVSMSTTGPSIETLIGSSNEWTGASVDFSQLFLEKIASLNVDLTKENTVGAINKVGNNVHTILPRHTSRSSAISAGLDVGDMFLNTKSSNNEEDWIIDVVI